jgi:hypothetical protein
MKIELKHLLKSKTENLERLATFLGVSWVESKIVWLRGVEKMDRHSQAVAKNNWRRILAGWVDHAIEKRRAREWDDVAFDDCICQDGGRYSPKEVRRCKAHTTPTSEKCGARWKTETCSRLPHSGGMHRSEKGVCWYVNL